MAPKRALDDPPPTDAVVSSTEAGDRPLLRILRVLEETRAARQSIVADSTHVQDCLRAAEDLHRMLLMAQTVEQRVLEGPGDPLLQTVPPSLGPELGLEMLTTGGG